MDGRVRTGKADAMLRVLERPVRFEWVGVLRLLFVALLFGLTSSSYLHITVPFHSYSGRVLSCGLLVACAMLVMRIALRAPRARAKLRYVELIVEQAVWTTLIYVSGGATSGATALYGLTCLIGAIVIGTRGPLTAAVAAAMFYSLLCSALVAGVLDPPRDQPRSIYATEPHDLVYPFLINLLVLTLVAVLAEHLAKRLTLTGRHLVAATRRAEDAERLAALGRIAAGLAHEIRNPLGSILGSVQLITSAPSVSAEARHLCGIVERETARLNDLVEDMMQLARPRPPVLTVVDLARSACEVAALAAQSGRGGDVVVRYQGPTSDVAARADAGQLRQVMWNLLRNAVQASSPGAQVTLRVTAPDPTESRHRPALGSFEVEDHGPGISEEARSRLFDAFFTTRSNGIGIGLAVVKRIVDEHGWRIEVEAERGVGAVFRVVFPTVDLAETRADLAPASVEGPEVNGAVRLDVSPWRS